MRLALAHSRVEYRAVRKIKNFQFCRFAGSIHSGSVKKRRPLTRSTRQSIMIYYEVYLYRVARFVHALSFRNTREESFIIIEYASPSEYFFKTPCQPPCPVFSHPKPNPFEIMNRAVEKLQQKNDHIRAIFTSYSYRIRLKYIFTRLYSV